MMIKPIKEWKMLTKCFFLFFGFMLAMILYPEKEKEIPVVSGAIEATVKNPVDFFSAFREDRQGRRSEKAEMYQTFLNKINMTEEEKRELLMEIESTYQKNALEDKVESILIGRGYQDVIFSLENALSLLIIKGEELDATEREGLIQFIEAYSGVAKENLSIFTIKN